MPAWGIALIAIGAFCVGVVAFAWAVVCGLAGDFDE